MSPSSTALACSSLTLFAFSPFDPQLFCFATDLAKSPVVQKMCMYGFFSTIAFSVNFFLAERVCHPKVRAYEAFSYYALAVYELPLSV